MKIITKTIRIVAVVATIFFPLAVCENSTHNNAASKGNNNNNSSDGNTKPVFYSVTFDSNGGDSVPCQNVEKGKNATEPEKQTRAVDAEGLYVGTPEIIFKGWYNGETKWDFAAPIDFDLALTAHWDIPIPIDLPEGNLVDNAANYIGNNVDAYTLLLGNDYNSKGKTLNNNSKLVIIGLGQERTISLSENGILLTLKENFELTLGKNITLLGRNGNNNALVLLDDRAVKLNMHDGSKITGNSGKPDISTNYQRSGAAGVAIRDGTLTMQGGEIIGNANKWDAVNDFAYAAASGVFISRFGTLKMEGGRIADNNGGVANIVYMAGDAGDADTTPDGPDLVLSGDATIESIALTSVNYTVQKSIAIKCESWNPASNVTLHLSATGWFGQAKNLDETRDIFLGVATSVPQTAYILKAASGNLNDVLGNFTLGNFFNDKRGKKSIYPYKILNNGKLGK